MGDDVAIVISCEEFWSVQRGKHKPLPPVYILQSRRDISFKRRPCAFHNFIIEFFNFSKGPQAPWASANSGSILHASKDTKATKSYQL